MKISLAGTGKMGSAMAARLLSEGHHVTVWNRTTARAEPLLALGATLVPLARELCAGAELVISMLTDEQALDDVYFSADGLLAGNSWLVIAQVIGVLVAGAYSFVFTFVVAKILDKVMGLAVTEPEEEVGLDISEHGERAYA